MRTGALHCVCAMVNNACALLDTTVKDALVAPLAAGFVTSLADLTTGQLDGGTRARRRRAEYFAAVNNLEAAAAQALRVASDMARLAGAKFPQDQIQLDSALSALNDLAGTFRRLAAVRNLVYGRHFYT